MQPGGRSFVNPLHHTRGCATNDKSQDSSRKDGFGIKSIGESGPAAWTPARRWPWRRGRQSLACLKRRSAVSAEWRSSLDLALRVWDVALDPNDGGDMRMPVGVGQLVCGIMEGLPC